MSPSDLLEDAADLCLAYGDPIAAARERRQRRAIEHGLRPPRGMYRVPIEQVAHSVSADDIISPEPDTAVQLDRAILLARLPHETTPPCVRRSVALWAQGENSRDIGAHLHRSPRTIQRHLRWAQRHARPVSDIDSAAVVLALRDLDKWAAATQPQPKHRARKRRQVPDPKTPGATAELSFRQ